jgi:cation diffusion facilitator family transporter
MGSHCCGHTHPPTSQDGNSQALQKKALAAAFVINISVLGVEVWGGLSARSEAVLADAGHLTSHVLVILLSWYALTRGERWKAKAALLKGVFVLSLGMSILFEAWTSLLNPHHLPEPIVMSFAVAVALLGNLATLWVMAKHRNEDLNMKSAWACSKADLLTNLALIGASLWVATVQTGWPDGGVGLLLGVMVARSGMIIVRDSRRAIRLLI